jgi:hypothetical protein
MIGGVVKSRFVKERTMSKRFGYQSLHHLEMQIIDKETKKIRYGKLSDAASCTSVRMENIERQLDENGYYEDARWMVSVAKPGR